MDGDDGYQLRLAQLLVQQGKPAAGLAALEPLLPRHPHDSVVIRTQGRCLEAIGNIPGVRVGAWFAFILIRAFASPTLGWLRLPAPMTVSSSCQQRHALLRLACSINPLPIPFARSSASSRAPDNAAAATVWNTYHPLSSPVPSLLQSFASYMLALSFDPSDVDTHVAVGQLYKSRGMLAEAAASLSTAHELRPEDGFIREALATVLTDLGTGMKAAGAS